MVVTLFLKLTLFINVLSATPIPTPALSKRNDPIDYNGIINLALKYPDPNKVLNEDTSARDKLSKELAPLWYFDSDDRDYFNHIIGESRLHLAQSYLTDLIMGGFRDQSKAYTAAIRLLSRPEGSKTVLASSELTEEEMSALRDWKLETKNEHDPYLGPLQPTIAKGRAKLLANPTLKAISVKTSNTGALRTSNRRNDDYDYELEAALRQSIASVPRNRDKDYYDEDEELQRALELSAQESARTNAFRDGDTATKQGGDEIDDEDAELQKALELSKQESSPTSPVAVKQGANHYNALQDSNRDETANGPAMPELETYKLDAVTKGNDRKRRPGKAPPSNQFLRISVNTRLKKAGLLDKSKLIKHAFEDSDAELAYRLQLEEAERLSMEQLPANSRADPIFTESNLFQSEEEQENDNDLEAALAASRQSGKEEAPEDIPPRSRSGKEEVDGPSNEAVQYQVRPISIKQALDISNRVNRGEPVTFSEAAQLKDYKPFKSDETTQPQAVEQIRKMQKALRPRPGERGGVRIGASGSTGKEEEPPQSGWD